MITLPAEFCPSELVDQLTRDWQFVLRGRINTEADTSVPQMLSSLEKNWRPEAPSTASAAKILVLSSSSGTGKTHFGRYLRERGWHPIARYKDRAARPDETDGIDAHFVNQGRFEEMQGNHELIEVTGSYGDHRGYRLSEILSEVGSHTRCVSSDGYSLVRLVAKTPQLLGLNMLSVYLLPPDLPTLVARILGRSLDRFSGAHGKTIAQHLQEQKVTERLLESSRYLRQAFDKDTRGRPLVNRFVVYDDPVRVAHLLGLSD